MVYCGIRGDYVVDTQLCCATTRYGMVSWNGGIVSTTQSVAWMGLTVITLCSGVHAVASFFFPSRCWTNEHPPQRQTQYSRDKKNEVSVAEFVFNSDHPLSRLSSS